MRPPTTWKPNPSSHMTMSTSAIVLSKLITSIGRKILTSLYLSKGVPNPNTRSHGPKKRPQPVVLAAIFLNVASAWATH